MRFLFEQASRGNPMMRVFTGGGESAYFILGLRGPRAQIEFPSDWHERRRAWVRLGFGLFDICFSFPWSKTVPDDGQCSGPTYGFYFSDDHLVIQWGKMKSIGRGPQKFLYMPWCWKHREHRVVGNKQTHAYRYVLRSGKVQERTATIQEETRLWTRYWLPHRLFKRSINVEFNDEVGERTGSWKGGTIGCGYDMKTGETPYQTLMRMERERQF